MPTGIPIMTVEITLPRDPALFQRDHNRFAREANRYAAEYHWRHHIPRHFQSFAKTKYGYFKRTEKYQKRKINLVGRKPDNVFSGRSQREMTNNTPKWPATPKGARLIMKMPIGAGTGRILDAAAAARLHAAGKRKNKGFTERQAQSQINVIRRKAEMESVSADEVRTLMRVRNDKYVQQANEPGVKKRIRIRTK